MVSRRFVMNRRLFSYSELPFCDTFTVVVICKAESVAVAVQSHIVAAEALQSRRFAYRFSWNGHILNYVSLADRFAALLCGSPHSFFLPICADDAVLAAE